MSLEVQNLTKTYGDVRAVDHLSFEMPAPGAFGLIGTNGAGKTTTLRSVAGIQQFDKGEIFIAGHSVRTEPLACKRALAYIPDNPDLYDFMSGIKYLNFIADIFGVDLYAVGLGEQIEGMVKELYAGNGAVRKTLHKYTVAR